MRLQAKQQSDAVTRSELGPLSQGEGHTRNQPLCCLESSRDTARKRRTPPLVGNKAKPDNTDNKKTRSVFTLVRNFSFDIISSSQEQTYTCGQDKRSSHFWLQKEQKRQIRHSVCYVQQYCSVHFINKKLPATAQRYLNTIPLSHKEQQMSIPVRKES